MRNHVLLICAFIGQMIIVLSQEEVQQNVTESSEDKEAINRAKLDDLLQEKENLNTLLKTLHYSCIVLARFQLSTYNNKLMEFLKTFSSTNDQNIIWQKLYTTHVLNCQRTITYEDSVKIFTQIKSNEFEYSQYQYVFNDMSLEQFQDLKPETISFTPEETKTWKFIEDFEDSMDQKQKEKEEEDDLLTRKPQTSLTDLEPRVFGFQLKVSNMTQIIVLLSIFFFFGAGFLYMYKKITTDIAAPKNKKKKKNARQE